MANVKVTYVGGVDEVLVRFPSGAELVGGVVKVFQSAQPTSPGAHLPNITAYVSSIEADPGILQSAGVGVYAVTLRVEVTIQASVEQ